MKEFPAAGDTQHKILLSAVAEILYCVTNRRGIWNPDPTLSIFFLLLPPLDLTCGRAARNKDLGSYSP